MLVWPSSHSAFKEATGIVLIEHVDRLRRGPHLQESGQYSPLDKQVAVGVVLEPLLLLLLLAHCAKGNELVVGQHDTV